MFCQNCGAAEQASDSYCKRCGEWLPDLKRRRGRRFVSATPEQLLNKVLVLGGLSSLASLVATVLLFTAGASGPVVKSVMLAASFTMVACAWQLISTLIGVRLKRRLTSARTGGAERPALAEPVGRQPALAAADTSRFADVRSVTEGTTELLEPLPRRGRDTGELR